MSRNAADFGSLSLLPPDRNNTRSCGDVVAFAASEGLFPRAQYHIKEVLYRIWWTSGSERGVLSLNVPGRKDGLAQLPTAGCELPAGHPNREGGLLFTSARVPVDLHLSGEEMARLYFTLDADNASVFVFSSPSRASMIVLNPPSDQELRGRDKDGDGHDDLQELGDPRRDPFRADPADDTPISKTGAKLTPGPKPVTPLPEAQRQLKALKVTGAMNLAGEVLHHTGNMIVTGHLTLDGSTIILAGASQDKKSANSDELGGSCAEILKHQPRIVVQPGGRLHIKGGSTVAAANPAEGFSIHASEGATLILEDSRFVHPGTSRICGENQPRHMAGVMVRSHDAVIRRNTFIHGLHTISAGSKRIVIEQNTFINNAVDMEVMYGNAEILRNRSLGAGISINVNSIGKVGLIRGNRLDWCVEACIAIQQGGDGGAILDNEIRRSQNGLALMLARGVRVAGNTLHLCGALQEKILSNARVRKLNTIEGNTLLRGTDCPWIGP